ncbi:hypothetical protein VP01_2111g1 [Puccinia sorghi]|uniref:Uncharacterized protein n=1 Tax=Puccinia sorghi TaxID=27349 RepID=A0A0L6VA30_9BASI|nr:hypothetical protein VP01_2111g1 [Puccinia sorghi]
MAMIPSQHPTEHPGPSSSPQPSPPSRRRRYWKPNKIFFNQLKFIGPGIVAASVHFPLSYPHICCQELILIQATWVPSIRGFWATDLEAGSTFGYAHLFVILLASIMAILLQILATRLGYITGKDLAQHCRMRFYDRPSHTTLWRWSCLYPLYAIYPRHLKFLNLPANGFDRFTDLAELLGSAIALKMSVLFSCLISFLLIPRLPLWVGVLLTSTDVFIVLAFFNSYPDVSQRNRRSMHIFEFSIAILVLVVLVSFIVLIVNVQPDWGDTFSGFLPSRAMIVNGGLYLAVSIAYLLCAGKVTNVYLFHRRDCHASLDFLSLTCCLLQSTGSKVAISDRLKSLPIEDKETQLGQSPVPSVSQNLSPIQHSGRLANIQITNSDGRQISPVNVYVTSVEHSVDIFLMCPPKKLMFLLYDTGHSCLRQRPKAINAAILIVAAAAFYYAGSDGPSQVADLASAHELLSRRVGVGSGYIFAIALLVAGQAASITVTLAGQIVSEGFIEWRTRPVVRRLVTRLIGIVPSAIVAASVGPKGVDDLLVGSQVALSLVLPFVDFIVTIILSLCSHHQSSKGTKLGLQNSGLHLPRSFVVLPLIIFTSDPHTMTMPSYHAVPSASPISSPTSAHPPKPSDRDENEGPLITTATHEHTFENNLATKIMVSLIFCTCCVANVYAIVQLAQGRT